MSKSRGGKAFYRVTSKRYMPQDQRRNPSRFTSDWKTEEAAIKQANEFTRRGHEDVRIRKYVEVGYDDNRVPKETTNADRD